MIARILPLVVLVLIHVCHAPTQAFAYAPADSSQLLSGWLVQNGGKVNSANRLILISTDSIDYTSFAKWRITGLVVSGQR